MKLKNLRPRSREALALGCQHFCILLQVEHADPLEILQGGAAENWGINYVQLDNAFYRVLVTVKMVFSLPTSIYIPSGMFS